MPAASTQSIAEILVLGAKAQWPDPLPALVAGGLVRVRVAGDLYAAAALLRGANRRYAALLVDPEQMSARALRVISNLKRHITMPIWSLPTQTRSALVSELGILPWENAARALGQMSSVGKTRESAEGGKEKAGMSAGDGGAAAGPMSPGTGGGVAEAAAENVAESKAHNSPRNEGEKHAKMPVETRVAARYDGIVATPLLSQQERRTLLGSAAGGGAVPSRGGNLSAVSQTTSVDPLLAQRMVAPAWLLTVGPEAARAGRAISEQAHCQVTAAESLVEATLVSGNVSGLILIDAGAETDQLEAGLRALRGLNPEARIVLLCEPVDEVTCRHALAWGADDYEIVPADRAGLRRLAGMTSGQGAVRAKAAVAGAARGVENWGSVGAASAEEWPAISVSTQTQLLEEILEGGGVKGDFAARTTWALARRLKLGGALQFVEVAEEGSPEISGGGKVGAREYRQLVAFGGQAAFGTLVWTPAKEEAGAGTKEAGAAQVGILTQAANWLGVMLALAQRYEQMRLMAITDELSGAYNRRYFMKYMEALLTRAREDHSRVTLLMFDIDNFKSYNDNFGHAAGDAIIRELIKLLRGCTRPKDLVARIGGDEFAVVYWDNEPPRMPNSEHPKEIVAATERFREAIRQHQWPEICRIKGTVSISGGLATFPRDAETLEALMKGADEALLKAKAGGKNVIVLHGEAGK